MDFSIEHLFDAAPQEVAAVTLDLDYQRSLEDIGALRQRSVLSQEQDASGRVVRRVRCVLALNVSGAAQRFLGGGDPAWIEESTWDPTAMTWGWVILPEVAADLLTANGSVRFHGNAGPTTRRIDGRVRVHVPVYGGRVEGWIVEGVRRAYDEEAGRLAGWLAQSR